MIYAHQEYFKFWSSGFTWWMHHEDAFDYKYTVHLLDKRGRKKIEHSPSREDERHDKGVCWDIAVTKQQTLVIFSIIASRNKQNNIA